MMSNEFFAGRLTLLRCASEDEDKIRNFEREFISLMADHSRDFGTIQTDDDRAEWERRKTLLSDLVHRQTAYVANFAIRRLREGSERGRCN